MADVSNSNATNSLIMSRVRDAVRQGGISRASLYKEAAAGNIRMVKYGRTALVDMASLRDFLSRLPTKQVRGQAAA